MVTHLAYDPFLIHLQNRNEVQQPVDVEAFYQEREERMKKVHKEELEEIQERLLHVKERAKTDLEEYQEDLQFERQRRITDLQKQQEGHQEAIEALKQEYTSNLERIREFYSFEVNSSKDARDTIRY